MGRVVAILQSNYIPWKGYFDLIRQCDEFVLYDDAQYTKNDWRNRNRIKTPHGTKWLTVPVRVERFGQTIRETRVADGRWAVKHWKALEGAYGRAPFFAAYREPMAALYRRAADLPLLSDVNELFLAAVASHLGIRTPITRSARYPLANSDPSGRLVDVCLAASAAHYLTGPAARAYLDESRFRAAGIEVRWMDYAGYPEYLQLHGPFEHAVTALDLLFHLGPRAADGLVRGRHAA